MKKIGPYPIIGLLGKGGMSRVYKVILPVIGRIAALKILKPDPMVAQLMGAKRIRELFESEAITLGGLRHPHIIDIWGYDHHHQSPFYLMEYYCNNLGALIGESYRTEMPSRPIRTDKAIDYSLQILDGLACLHRAGIIHRDIKPYNILISDQDTIKITDFGLSKSRGETFGGPKNLKIGSPWYAAPEQEQNPDSVDFSADTYAVGVMLYRMLTGNLPHNRRQRPSQASADLDQDWDAFMDRALQKEPGRRFVDAQTMATDFQALAAQWRDRQARICMSEPTPNKSAVAPPGAGIVYRRPHSIKMRLRAARQAFGLNDCWQPLTYVTNRLERLSQVCLLDRATGLIWQSGGSLDLLDRSRAQAYVKGLNEGKLGGFSDWRLPTVDELTSLLKPVPRGSEFCTEPMFDRRQKWLWSCDRKSFRASWYVNMEMGYVDWQDDTCYFYVRAVRPVE